MPQINDEIIKIKDAIVSAVDVEKLYLFGSHAYGTPRDNSDYDFYMVIPNGGMRPLDAMTEARMSLWGTRVKAVDILAGTTETFERRSKKVWTVESDVFNKGVLLYER
ncbi:MAG: nucleotidyltransferase domain-containing protein [Oscillospiraceae bacterium]|nr:nucleotidyltransferase domain-containing protein [Oscillospiraceae bacterium]